MKVGVVAVVLFCTWGCGDPPQLKSVEIAPRFFCDGDQVEFKIEALNVDNLRLTGTGFEQSFPNNTGGTIKRATKYSEAPFDIKGKVKDYGDTSLRTVPQLAALAPSLLEVSSINNDTWQAPLGPVRASAVGAISEERNDTLVSSEDCYCHATDATKTKVERRKHEIWTRADTFEFVLDKTDFGPKAKLVGIKNCAPLGQITATISSPTFGTTTLPSQKDQPLPGTKPPWGTYRVTLNQVVDAQTATEETVKPAECCGLHGNRTESCSISGKYPACYQAEQRLCLMLYVRCDP